MKPKEIQYELTLKGLLLTTILDQQLADSVWNAIELYGLRNKKNAIVLKKGGEFVHLRKST